MPWAAAAAAAAAIGGGMISADASKSAANTQANSARNATDLQASQFNQTQRNLLPYRSTGAGANNYLANLLGIPGYQQGTRTINGQDYNFDQVKDIWRQDYLKKLQEQGQPASALNEDGLDAGVRAEWDKATPTQGGDAGFGSLLKPFDLNQFQQSPAYQFNLDQGRMAIDKASAARGKYYAPSTLQDIAKYSQGLASNEFQNAFSNYNTTQGNIFSRLQSLSGAGQNASVSLGGFGQNMANASGNNLIGAGNAQAAGQIGSANAINSGMSNAYNNYMMQQILSQNQQPTYTQQPSGGGVTGGFDPSSMSMVA